MRFRLFPIAIATAIILAPIVPSAGATSTTDLPSSFVALGDSLTTAWGSGISNGANVPGDNRPSSWATGSDPVVDSQMLRLEQAGATVSSAVNLAVPGAKVTDATGIVAQAQSVPTDAGYVLIETGSSDVCADTTLTPAADFKASVEQALTTITQRAPNAKILIASIPNWYQLWQDFPNESRGDTCPLLFGSDPSTFVATDASRQAVAQATIDDNDALAAACAEFAACKYDGGAVYDIRVTLDDVSTVDHFHPSRSGQAKIAAATWAAGWFASTQVPDLAQFGYTTPGSSSGAPGEGSKFGSLFTLTDAAKLVDFGFYTIGASASGGQSFVPTVYSTDAAGDPDALLVQGDPIIVHPGQDAGWVRGPLPATTLQPGKYVLALVSGPISNGAPIAFDSNGTGFFNTNDYPTPSDPFGTPTPSTQQLSVFVDYTAGTPDVPTLAGVPADVTAEATGANGAAVSYTSPTATDSVDGSLAVSCDPAAQTTFALGVTTVTCSATNQAGETASATFTVTVRDTTPPTLQGLPANFSVDAMSASGATVTYTVPTAEDLVDGARPVTCSPASGSVFAIGATTVTCSASDTRQNTRSASFVVTVAPLPQPSHGRPAQPTTPAKPTTPAPPARSLPHNPPPAHHVAASAHIRHVWVGKRGRVWITVAQVGGTRFWVRVDGKRNTLSRSVNFARSTRLRRGRHTLQVELVSKSALSLVPPVRSQRLVVRVR